MAQHQAVMHIHSMLYIHVDKHTVVFLQVLGFGSSCKDAILCIHLHATSVRVPGMVASWSWAETGGSMNTLSPSLFRSLLCIRSMLQLYKFLHLYKFLSWWGVRAELRRGSQLTWVKCFYPTPFPHPQPVPQPVVASSDPWDIMLWRPDVKLEAIQSIVYGLTFMSRGYGFPTARASWWNDNITSIQLCLSNCL